MNRAKGVVVFAFVLLLSFSFLTSFVAAAIDSSGFSLTNPRGSAATGGSSSAIGSSGGATGWEEFGLFGRIARYLFGTINVEVRSLTSNDISAAIVTIAVWIMVWITFGDIIKTFSTFSPGVAWGVGFLVAVIAANLGWITMAIVWMTGVFAIIGVVSVFLGLLGVFAAFIVVNLGITKLGGWIKNRRAMQDAATARAGGTRVGGAIEGLSQAERALRKAGK